MDLPVVDLSRYLVAVSESRFDDGQLSELCCEVSRTLRETGALLVRDPRCSIKDNDRFIDMMERYFESPSEFKLLQERPQLHYQELNAEPVILEGFPEWKDTMDSWGYKMISAIETVAEMAAVGFGLPKDVFTSLMNQGPHLLAPTGSDLQRYGQEGTVFAGYHYDLNFLTIHGRSRFPGLNIWLRNGQKDEVKVPVGCLLIQAGKQIEWLTGGDCIAGMHEVVVTKRTIDAIKLASEQNHSLWRVSSTLFAQIALDAILKPLGHFAEFPLAGKYPSMYTVDYVVQELEVINLKERQRKCA